jgi:hypothetical protein
MLFAGVYTFIAYGLAPTAALGQGGQLICCNQLIDVGGDWDTASRRCTEYMNESTASRAKVCSQLIKGECSLPAVDTRGPAVDTLLALLLPASAQAQTHVVVMKDERGFGERLLDGLLDSGPQPPVGCYRAAWGNEIHCRVQNVSGLGPPPPPTVCCPEAAALCEQDSCKDDPPAQGFVHSDARATGVPGQLRSEPSVAAPSVGTVPNGARLQYTEFRRVGGHTWFHVKNPGGGAGWLSADGASCERPSAPPPRRPLNVKPSGTPGAATSNPGGNSGARG